MRDLLWLCRGRVLSSRYMPYILGWQDLLCAGCINRLCWTSSFFSSLWLLLRLCSVLCGALLRLLPLCLCFSRCWLLSCIWRPRLDSIVCRIQHPDQAT